MTEPLPTGQDVADFLGQGDDDTIVALAGQHVAIITAMARGYTRGRGFDPETGEPAADVAAVITTACARLVANPEQSRYGVGNVQVYSGFTGWSLPELFILNRYRARSR